MRMRVRRRAALAASAVFLGGCFLIYLIIEMTMLPHQDEPVRHQSKREESTRRHADALSGGSDWENKNELPNPLSPASNISSALRSASWHQQQCSGIGHLSAEIQMLDMYKDMKFENPDGGVWKQGWNIVYNENDWSPRRKLRVFVVPHSHNDPGWLKTFEDYYSAQTRHILNNMVRKLSEDSRRKFIWAEMSFFSMWWDEISLEMKEKVKILTQGGQLELVTAGWVMNDEANTHYFNMLTQLTEGHLWALKNLGYKPKNSWSIDPFGQSPSMAFLVQRSGLSNLLIQRVHYSVKKILARKRQLEFRWRQSWDTTGSVDLFTHMMPFYSYDVPHTCGPDPKICCQFDFKRLPGFGVSCPWKVPPKVITKVNVAERSELLLDQYRKKSKLYRTNVVLAPLGDDFRYDHASEWDSQYNNYQKIFDYLNSHPNLHVNASFGTLNDYFQAVREEQALLSFPTLSGDFFTYADRDDHYWSGYYTSRPFYKRMDRIVMSYLRSADLMFTLAWSEQIQTSVAPVNSIHSWLTTSRSGLLSLLENARRHVSLFQHHDGVTGTARDNVVEDYGKKMLEAIKACQHVMQMSAYALLAPREEVGVPEPDAVFFSVDDTWHDHYSQPEPVLTLGKGVDSRRVVLSNTLTWRRHEVISLRVSTPYVKVTDSHGQIVPSQTNPVFQPSGMSESQFDLVFIADIAALGLTTYLLSVVQANDPYSKNRLAEVRVSNTINHMVRIASAFRSATIEDTREASEFSVQSERLSAAFSSQGLLKALTLRETGYTVPLHLDFAKYGTRDGLDRSGAYLFLPDGEARVINNNNRKPLIRVVEGPILSRVEVDLPGVLHTVTLKNSPGVESLGLEIVNYVNIAQFANFEMVMRLSSNIRSGDEFFTDLNGLQMIRRMRLKQLPLQGNYYPLPSVVFIQDAETRLSVLSAQPLGVSSLVAGQIEVMQDRRLLQDDNRGLGQGVEDNRSTRTTFRLVLERRKSSCQDDSSSVPANTLVSQLALNSMLYPIHRLSWHDNTHPNLHSEFTATATRRAPELDVHLVSLRTITTLPAPGPPRQHINESNYTITGGLVLHRLHVDHCFITPSGLLQGYTAQQPGDSNGMVDISSLFPNHFGQWLQAASLSFLHTGPSQDRSQLQPLCAMDMRSFLLCK